MANTATIARIWKGRVAADRADEYERYWLSELPPLREKALALDLFREDRASESEFTSISYWADLAALMAANKVKSPTEVHHLDRDVEFLIETPKTVQVVRVLPDSAPHH